MTFHTIDGLNFSRLPCEGFVGNPGTSELNERKFVSG